MSGRIKNNLKKDSAEVWRKRLELRKIMVIVAMSWRIQKLTLLERFLGNAILLRAEVRLI